MAYNLTGKAVQTLQLAAAGESLGVKVMMAKQNDANSRFIHAIIRDSRGKIDCSGASVQLNVTLPDGSTQLTAYGEIIDGEPYVLIPRNFLATEGKLSCDITLTGVFNQFDTSIGSSSGITAVSVNEDTFTSKVVGEGGQYVFRYDGSDWKLNNVAVTLSQYGITTTGTAATDDTIIITYSTTYVLTTETFYILVVSSNYKTDAGAGIDATTFVEYVRGLLGDMAGDIADLDEQLADAEEDISGIHTAIEAMQADIAMCGFGLYLDRATNKIYLVDKEEQLLGDGITLPETVNGFVVEPDENGNNYLYLAYNGEIVGDGVELPSGGGGGGGGGGDLTDYTPNGGYTGTAQSLKDLIDGLQNDLDDLTYTKPTIAEFSVVTSSHGTISSNRSIEYSDSFVNVTGFNHRETDITKYVGNLTISMTGTGTPIATPAPTATTENISYPASFRYAGKTFTITGIDRKGNIISKSIGISFYYPSFIVKTTSASVTTDDLTTANKISSASLSGTRTVTLTEDSMIYFVSTTTINSIKSSGFDVPFERQSDLSFNSTTYKVYRIGTPDNMILAGTYTYVIS